jgi:hypothetical protein
MVTTGAVPLSPVSTRAKTNTKKEKIYFGIKSRKVLPGSFNFELSTSNFER